jgi:DNA-binding GntR family transcriptional regulator
MSVQSLVDYTREYLENAIITGIFPPGMRIKEEEIASRLQISRPPIRQAFESLVVEGLLTRQPRKGVVVTRIEEKDVWEIYTLKASLYSLATCLAIDFMTDEGIAKLEKAVQGMEKCAYKEPVNLTKYQALNEDFHINILLEICNHGRLHKLLHNLNNQTKRLSYKNLQDRNHLKSNCEYHKKMFEAIKAKDKGLAENFCQEHIFRGMDLLMRNLKK